MNSIVDSAAFAPDHGAIAIQANPAPDREADPPDDAATGACPNVWLLQLFAAKAAQSGGVVRRRLRDVEEIVGLDRFREAVARRGFIAITDGQQVVVFCHAGGVRRLA